MMPVTKKSPQKRLVPMSRSTEAPKKMSVKRPVEEDVGDGLPEGPFGKEREIDAEDVGEDSVEGEPGRDLYARRDCLRGEDRGADDRDGRHRRRAAKIGNESS